MRVTTRALLHDADVASASGEVGGRKVNRGASCGNSGMGLRGPEEIAVEDYKLMDEEMRLAVRQGSEQLRDGLPKELDPAQLGVMEKAPTKLLAAREALRWRTEELARNACDSLDNADLAAGAILTRAVIESAAMAWKMMHVLEGRKNRTADELDHVLMRLLLGSRIETDGPQAFNVLDHLDLTDKKVKGVRAAYDGLSEFAHPNWRGTLGLFSETDDRYLRTHFGRGFGHFDRDAFQVANVLAQMLELYIHCYNRISEIMPSYLAELQPIDSRP